MGMFKQLGLLIASIFIDAFCVFMGWKLFEHNLEFISNWLVFWGLVIVFWACMLIYDVFVLYRTSILWAIHLQDGGSAHDNAR